MKKVILTFVVMVFMTTLMFAVWDIEEDFDDGTNLPTDWSVINANGGDTWGISTTANKARSGSNSAAMPLGPAADDWLITPLISVQTGDTFTFWALANMGNAQSINVMLATGASGGNEVSDFTATTLGNESVSGTLYAEFVYNLDDHVGDVYLAIHQVTTSWPGLHIDDVKVGQEGDPPVPVNLSSFYALYIGGTPSIYWTTETETDNSYWNVYRGISDNFEAAALLNANNPVPGNGTTNNASDYVYEDSVPVIQNTTYWYWIEDVSLDGESEVHEPVTLSIPSEDTPVTPNYGLHQNYPNPFNPSTSISFALQEESNVEVIIYNVKGEKIKSIFNDHIDADQITVTVWDGNDAAGKQVSSGVYLYKLITDTKVYQKKMLLVK